MKYVPFVFIIVLFWSCSQTDATSNAIAPVPRDTSITIQNAYSELFIDSLSVENFLAKEVTSDSTVQRIRNFYNSRNFAFAWFNKEGLTLQAEGFWNAHDNYINNSGDSSIYDKQLHSIMDTLLSEDSLYQVNKDRLRLTELRLTKHFFDYVNTAYGASADPEDMQWHIPKRKLNPSAWLDSLLSAKHGDWKPLNRQFYLLEDAGIKYRSIEKNGGWMVLEKPTKKLKKGSSSKIITDLKKRLAMVSAYTETDTSALFTDALQMAVKKMQDVYGLTQNGVVDAALINELNVPVGDRIKQIFVNLERMKWMPEQPQDYIVANIPEYRFRVFENGQEALGMDIVVGKSANRTVVFSDELKYVVFSPYWNIPRSIVRNEIYPAMQRSSSYLRRNNMEVTANSNGLPVVRQKPGGSNALGLVKFIFPNTYNIYFHDTPAKSLFGRDKRAFSHGCIRLHQPFELAKYLLRNDDAWTDASIQKAMNSSKEKWVTLSQPLPVFITYFTSWVDGEGLIHFREDIYGHDKKLGSHLFE